MSAMTSKGEDILIGMGDGIREIEFLGKYLFKFLMEI
jgi:hypothetical protein